MQQPTPWVPFPGESCLYCAPSPSVGGGSTSGGQKLHTWLDGKTEPHTKFLFDEFICTCETNDQIFSSYLQGELSLMASSGSFLSRFLSSKTTTSNDEPAAESAKTCHTSGSAAFLSTDSDGDAELLLSNSEWGQCALVTEVQQCR